MKFGRGRFEFEGEFFYYTIDKAIDRCSGSNDLMK